MKILEHLISISSCVPVCECIVSICTSYIAYVCVVCHVYFVRMCGYAYMYAHMCVYVLHAQVCSCMCGMHKCDCVHMYVYV